MMITTIICLTVSLISGKASVAVTGGQAFRSVTERYRKNALSLYKRNKAILLNILKYKNILFKGNIDHTDFAVSADTHCRAPDTGP